MPDDNRSNSSLKESYWQYFFTDNYHKAIETAQLLQERAREATELSEACELEAKILLKRGNFKAAQEVLARVIHYSPIKYFIDFLLNGKIQVVENGITGSDLDSNIFRAQALLFSKIYWGGNYDIEPILEDIFNQLIDEQDYDRAVLASLQSLELIILEQEFGKDLIEPVVKEHLTNLLELSQKARYQSTKAKVYLLIAKMFKNREAAEDAEILFGKEGNQNGLAEVYSLYATDFNENRDENLKRALDIFMRSNNISAQGYIYENLASEALAKGNVQEALRYFSEAEQALSQGGLFEKTGLEIQRLSLMAIKGEFKRIKERANELIESDIPKLFKAQIAQILANTIIQIDSDVITAKALITYACDLLEELRRFNQLLQAKNILFQIALLDDDLNQTLKLGEEIIQLSDRLGDENSKATKYVDLAFAIVRGNMSSQEVGDKEMELSTKYFNQAIEIYKSNNNIIGEADVYQSMGNLFANINRSEDAYNSFKNARELYKSENALLQCAITDSLIGILMLDFTMLSEHTYDIAYKHLEEAFMYYQREGFHDLCWKNAFYIADLNEKFYIATDEDRFKTKAKHYYIEMLQAIRDFDVHSETTSIDVVGGAGITTDEALSKGAGFFFSIKEDEIAREFRKG